MKCILAFTKWVRFLLSSLAPPPLQTGTTHSQAQLTMIPSTFPLISTTTTNYRSEYSMRNPVIVTHHSTPRPPLTPTSVVGLDWTVEDWHGPFSCRSPRLYSRTPLHARKSDGLSLSSRSHIRVRLSSPYHPPSQCPSQR